MRCSPVYEFHDINANNFSQVAAELQKCGSDIKWSLMVIPGDLAVEAPKEFTAQLLKWKKAGHSLYLHGYVHKADLSLKRSLWGKLVLRITNFEAEFAGLSVEDSDMLLQKALQSWQRLNVGQPEDFVAPAWYGRGSSRFIIWKNARNRLSIPFSTAGIPKITVPFVNLCEKIYVKMYGAFSFLPVPRIVKHP